jgi:hypothetical protein
MPHRDGTFDRCISLLMLNFLPDYRQAAAVVCHCWFETGSGHRRRAGQRDL